MSTVKPRKVYSRGYPEGYYINTKLPVWRNWIRRHSYSCNVSATRDIYHHDKDAVRYLLLKYKSKGRMLMKTQGQDYW